MRLTELILPDDEWGSEYVRDTIYELWERETDKFNGYANETETSFFLPDEYRARAICETLNKFRLGRRYRIPQYMPGYQKWHGARINTLSPRQTQCVIQGMVFYMLDDHGRTWDYRNWMYKWLGTEPRYNVMRPSPELVTLKELYKE